MKLIELFGMSRAGKTTQQRILCHKLTEEGYACKMFTRPKINFKEIGSLERFHLAMLQEMKDFYERASISHVDFLLYDRGFYDREVLLRRDLDEGRISKPFQEYLHSDIEKYSAKVDYPLMFVIDPITSLKRWKNQVDEGLDNSSLSAGLERCENKESLEKLRANYSNFGLEHAEIKVIDAERSKEQVTEEIIHLLNICIKERNINLLFGEELCLKK